MPTVNFSCTEQNKEQLKFNLITLLKYGKGNINFMVGREIDKILVGKIQVQISGIVDKVHAIYNEETGSTERESGIFEDKDVQLFNNDFASDEEKDKGYN